MVSPPNHGRQMRINAPVTLDKEVELLAQAGADELYCGVVEPGNPPKADIGRFYNRRPTPEGNLASFQDLEAVVGKAHRSGIPVSFVLNQLYYSPEQFQAAMEQAQAAVDCGVDALIMSNPFLFEDVHRRKLPVKSYVSTTASVFNKVAVEFFSGMGASRIILPRQLRIEEIEAHIKLHPELEFEVIVLGDPCPWDDGHCTFEHNLHLLGSGPGFCGGGCHLPYDISAVSLNGSGRTTSGPEEQLIMNLKRFVMLSGCGLCSLWDLRRAGVHVLKSTSRDDSLLRPHNVRYLSLVRHLLSDEDIDKASFQSYAREIRARMYYDFLAENLLKSLSSEPEDSRLGQKVRGLATKLWLLQCAPPFSCYLADCLVPEALPIPADM